MQHSRNILCLLRTSHAATREWFADVIHLLPQHSWEIIIPVTFLPLKLWHIALQEGCSKIYIMHVSPIHIRPLAKDEIFPLLGFYFYKKQFPKASDPLSLLQLMAKSWCGRAPESHNSTQISAATGCFASTSRPRISMHVLNLPPRFLTSTLHTVVLTRLYVESWPCILNP